MAAWKCTRCGNCYPVLAEFRRCLPCDHATWLSDSSEPMDIVEARSIRNHELFDRFCEQRDADKAKQTDELLANAFDAHT